MRLASCVQGRIGGAAGFRCVASDRLQNNGPARLERLTPPVEPLNSPTNAGRTNRAASVKRGCSSVG